MKQLPRYAVYAQLVAARFLPIFSHEQAEVAVQVGLACARGGASVFELTNRNASSLQAFQLLKSELEKLKSPLILGIGSIVEPGSAVQFINAGAQFVVSPSFNPEVAKLCNRRKIAYIPGCLTPSEIGVAEESGCELVKYFPASAEVGPEFIKALRGPCPWTSIVATGGIQPSKDGLKRWFDAGAAVVGLGSQLLEKVAIDRGDYAAVEAKVREVAGFVKALS